MKTPIKIPVFLRLALVSLCFCLTPFGVARAATISLDPNFVPPFLTTPDYARVLLQPDGKYLLYLARTLTDQPTGVIIRFLPDGTFDTSFDFDHDYEAGIGAALLPDGRLIVAADRIVYGLFDYNLATENILLLNTDGSIDPTFNPAAATMFFANPLAHGGGVRAIAIQPDGKILLAGFFGEFEGVAHPGIVRLLADGTLDPSFAAITLQFTLNPLKEFGLWAKPAIQPDGKILIAGDFEGVNGTPDPGVARLNSDGTLDMTFNATDLDFTRFAPNRRIRGVVVQSDGKIIIGGDFAVTGGAPDVPLVRLNSDGSIDQTYIYPTGGSLFFGSQIRDLVLQPDGKPIAISKSVYRFNTDGTLDSTFSNPVLIDNSPLDFPQAYTLNLLPDGRVLIGGSFSDIDDGSGTSNDDHWSVARFNSDGTLDPSLTTSHKTAEKAHLTSFTRQFDGSTLIAFDATSGSSAPALPHAFGRLLTDGALDPSFDPVASFDPNGSLGLDFLFSGFNLLADGKLLAFGLKDGAFGTFAYGKLFLDGTEDTNYTTGPNDGFSNAYPLSDGKVLMTSYSFVEQNVVDNTEVQRLNVDGTLDTSFQLDSSILVDTVQRDINGSITNIAADGGKILAVLADGKILFSYLALDSTSRLVRLTPDGAIDPLFSSASTPVATFPGIVDPAKGLGLNVPEIFGSTSSTSGFSDALVVGASQVIVVGGFDTYLGNAAHGIVRLNANGTVDTSFQTGGGAQWTQTTETTTFHPSVDNIELENDGKFLITGTFEAYNGTAAPGIASLNADGSLFESLGRIASRAKFDTFLSRAVLARQPDGSFLLGGPYVLPGQTEEPSFIHINSFGDVPIVGSPLIVNSAGGQPFTYQIVASGQPTSYSATGLPPGLSIDPLTGLISGTPTVGGTFLVTLSATNASGTGTATLTINLAPIIISPLSATGTITLPFSYQFEASGATSLAVDDNTLPLGLTFDPTLRAIVGNPAVEGTFQVGLSATNSGGTTSATLVLTVQPLPAAGPVIMSITSATGRTGSPFSFQTISSGGSSLARVNATDLPLGLSIDSVTGEISGTVTTDGSSLVTLSVTDAGVTNTSTLQLTFTSDPAVPVIVSPNTAPIYPGLPFSYTILAPTSDSSDPVAYSEVGPLPLGLSLDQQTGIISGTPQIGFGSGPAPALAGGVVTNVEIFACNSSGCAAQGILFLLPTGAANISTRLSVGTGDNVLIGGFITQGNAPMKLVVRGRGPSLTPFGVSGALANPYLELHSGALTIANNDNWKDDLEGGSQEVAIENTGLAPTDNLESAILAVLQPGGYTAIVHGSASGTGVGLVEVYDLAIASLDVSSEAHLGNISTRGNVQTEDNVMIGGFINKGATPIKVLVRGRGPSLTPFGVSGALANPTLELHKPDGGVVTNDDWITDPTQKAAITATGLAPTNDLESAILLTLPVGEGAYTAIVKGVDGTTGVGLVEAYFGNPCLGSGSTEVCP
jgi:uncharacterized delta-60 repeat protein